MRIPVKPPSVEAPFPRDNASLEEVRQFIRKRNQPDVQALADEANEKYLHWDKLRFYPMPEGIDPQVVWSVVKEKRSTQFITLPFKSVKDVTFRYWVPPQHQEWISTIDQQAGGVLLSQSASSISDDHQSTHFNSLMEEAIASSIIEGAVVTREIAKEMLRTQRPPRDTAEQMILNNYQTMLHIRDWKSEKMTPALLCEMQKLLTTNTLEKTDASGRFRRVDEKITVFDESTNEVIHTPPPAEELPKQMKELCDFANSKTSPYIHPVIKAIVLHFMMGYLHPFYDGNGRTARALFYWYMLKSGFWLFEYLPISRLILSSRISYYRSYLYTETDHNDVTYFNHYQLSVIVKAIHDFHAYRQTKEKESQQAQELLERFPDLNLRQRLLLQHAIHHPQTVYTVRGHEGKYRIAYNTAKADLYQLESMGLLTGGKKTPGRETQFRPIKNLVKKLS